MEVVLQLILATVGAAGVAGLLTWLAAGSPARRLRQFLPEGTPLRVKSSRSCFHARVLSVDRSGIRLGPALQREEFAPLQAGEPIVAEAPLPGRILTFRTRVAPQATDEEVWLSIPPRMASRDRREAQREPGRNREALVEGQSALLEDLSQGGVRFLVAGSLTRGERIAVQIEERAEPRFAWVLSCDVAQGAGLQKHRVRARFE